MRKQDTFSWGSSKGVGTVPIPLVVDGCCSLASATGSTATMPVTVCALRSDRVLPCSEALGLPVGASFPDNSREVCGRAEQRPDELLLALDSIAHRTTRVHSPRTTGCVKRTPRPLLDEGFRGTVHSRWSFEDPSVRKHCPAGVTPYAWPES